MDPEVLKEVGRPEKSALVVWDVQKALVDRIFNRDAFLKNVNELIVAARSKQIPVFFTRITPLPERFQMASRRHIWKNPSLGLTEEGLKLAIAPAEDDIVIPKNTTSIFIGTNFELMVRNAGLDTLVFTGITTEIGVESSARDALNRGFFTVIARDAVSSMSKERHDRSLANLESMVLLRTNDEIVDMWER